MVAAFEQALKRLGIDVRCGEAVQEILVEDGRIKGVVTKAQRKYPADAVILATGVPLIRNRILRRRLSIVCKTRTLYCTAKAVAGSVGSGRGVDW